MKALILGGAGFGGTGLGKALKERGHIVRVLDTVAPAHADLGYKPDGYLWKAAVDVTPRDLDGLDVIVNMAAQADVPMGFSSPRWTMQQNTEGAVALLEAVRTVPVGLVAHASTGNIYGRPIYLPIDEKHPPVPHNVYSASKIAQEMLFWAYHRMYGIPVSVMSNGVVIGPGMRREIFIFRFLRSIFSEEPITIEGGQQTRDVTYVSDVVDGWVRLLEAPPQLVSGEKFQISFGEEHRVVEIASWCFEACGQRPIAPDDPRVRMAPYRPGELGQRELFDCSKAERILGYRGRVPPREAIFMTADWVSSIVPGARAFIQSR